MKWKELEETDLAATISQSEIEAFRRDSAFDGSDPVPLLLARVAGKVRIYISSNPAICRALGPGMSVPVALVGAACDLAAYDILKRLPVPVGEDRKAARDAANKLLEDVASGRLTLEPENEGDGVAKTPRFTDPRPMRRLD